jgi:branched-chain amino acid transport system substrate-binding protein
MSSPEFFATGTTGRSGHLVQYIAKGVGGTANQKGKRLALVYRLAHGKEPIPVLEDLAKRYGFTFNAMPVTHPGVEQKSTWLQIAKRLTGCSFGVGVELRESRKPCDPRPHDLQVWRVVVRRGTDVTPAGDGAGLHALALHPVGHLAGASGDHQSIMTRTWDGKEGKSARSHNRGLIDGCWSPSDPRGRRNATTSR